VLSKHALIKIHFQEKVLQGEPEIPASKSESNRALMLSAYSKGKAKIHNLSDSDDTKVLTQLLASDKPVLDTGHAGTTFRFLTTFLAIKGIECTLTGSSRLQQRPIGILVDALRKLGAKIDYSGKTGFPPLIFGKFVSSGVSTLEIDPAISSQFSTSLMLAAPTLPQGLHLRFSNPEVSSISYLKMTWRMMQKMGIEGTFTPTEIRIPNQDFKQAIFDIENDWSAASYWLAMAGLSRSELILNGLRADSMQGDSSIIEILKPFGLESEFSTNQLKVSHSTEEPSEIPLILDLKSCPDLAQTLIVFSVLKGIPFRFSGLKTLAIKETNRLKAMQLELNKIGASLIINVEAGTCEWKTIQTLHPPNSPFETYEDHRMAMSLSLVALRFPIQIENPDVVSKSYPGYWDEMKKMGFSITSV